MAFLRSRFSRVHMYIALLIWGAFSVFTYFIVSANLSHAASQPMRVAITTACSALGPMTGAISRDFQGCCLRFSLSLLPYCLGGLAIAVIVQLLVPTRRLWVNLIRYVVWAAGLIVWFGGGIVSFGHALS